MQLFIWMQSNHVRSAELCCLYRGQMDGKKEVLECMGDNEMLNFGFHHQWAEKSWR